MRTRTATALAVCASLCFLATPPVTSQAETIPDPTIILSLDPSQADPEAGVTQAVEAAGGHVTEIKAITADTVAVTVTDATTSEASAIEDALADQPGVLAAETSRRVHPTTTGDTYYESLWNLNSGSQSSFGVNAEDAWSTSTGVGAVIGIIDTGITAHPDLDAHVIAGYDFVDNDTDPTDQGPEADTHWHGTHVAGIAAALRNAIGVVGVAPGASIEPIRALGVGGGGEDDLIAAVYWGAGLTVDGVAANTHPADVLNLSLAGVGSCSTAMQAAIDAAVNAGTAVVVATGNGDDLGNPLPITNVFPANCTNVIRVVATTKQGAKASYSNYGTAALPATLAAPGGDGDATEMVVSTWGAGGYAAMAGTSMAAPHVSGLIALLRALKPELTVAQLTAILTSTSKPVVGCVTDACGSGIASAPSAVAAAVPAPSPSRSLSPSPILSPSPQPTLGAITLSRPVKVGVAVRATVAVSPAGTPIRWTWRVPSGAVVSTTAQYTPVASDLGQWLWVHAETGASLQSNTGALVEAGSFTPVVRPRATGTFRVGRTVKASKGTWGPTPVTYRYQWYRGSTKISKATKSSYKLTKKDRRKKVWVKITVTRSGYTSASAGSTSHKVK